MHMIQCLCITAFIAYLVLIHILTAAVHMPVMLQLIVIHSSPVLTIVFIAVLIFPVPFPIKFFLTTKGEVLTQRVSVGGLRVYGLGLFVFNQNNIQQSHRANPQT